MFLKTKIAEIFTNIQTHFFATTTLKNRATKIIQYNSGGDDYCPCLNNEGLSECIGGNPADGVIFAWRDDVSRKSQQGEKRIYSVAIDPETLEPVLDDAGNMTVAAEIYLKNDGTIEAAGSKDLNITVLGNANLSVTNTLDIDAASITSSGDWVHTGNFTASHIEAGDGATGSFDITTAEKGIVK